MHSAVSLPDLSEIMAEAHVIRLPLRTRFRSLTERETMILVGPNGWGEFGPFLEYDDAESALWLAAAIEAAWAPPVPAVREVVPVNATVPAVSPNKVAEVLARFPGCTTAKIKVAQTGQSLSDDVARVREVRAVLGPQARLRVDANGAWDLQEAFTALMAFAPFEIEYAEQPCASISQLRMLREELRYNEIKIRIAADESVRKAADPFAVAEAGAADLVVLKVPPMGGVRATLEVAGVMRERYGLDVVMSSALETSIGLAAGVMAAAALPHLSHACGLGTAVLLNGDVTADPLIPLDGAISLARARAVRPDSELLTRRAAPKWRQRWWRERLGRCYAVLAEMVRSEESENGDSNS